MIPLRDRGARAVTEVWNASVSPKYRLDARFVEQNLFDHPLFHEEASLWHEDSFVAIKRSAASLYEGPDPKVAHVSLLGGTSRPPHERFPTLALQIAIERLRAEGFEALVVGQDSGHFLPGAPTDIPWMGLFGKLGFERGGFAFDLEHDVRVIVAGSPRLQAGSYGPVDEPRLPGLEEFLRREFPGRWHYDVMRKVEAEGPQTVFGLWIDETLQGFALLQREGCRLPIGGAVWQGDLGPRWGSLGPIGLSKGIRGQGWGTEFLNLALVELRELGAQRTIIDWTGLLEFYGAQGFSVTRAYRSYRLSLRTDPES